MGEPQRRDMSTSQEHEFGRIDDGYEDSTWVHADVSEWAGTWALALVH